MIRIPTKGLSLARQRYLEPQGLSKVFVKKTQVVMKKALLFTATRDRPFGKLSKILGIKGKKPQKAMIYHFEWRNTRHQERLIKGAFMTQPPSLCRFTQSPRQTHHLLKVLRHFNLQ